MTKAKFFRRFLPALLAAVTVACMLMPGSHASGASKNVYTFLIPTKSSVHTRDKNTSSLLQAFEKIITLSGKKAGMEFRIEYADAEKISSAGLLKYAKQHVGKDVDFAILTPMIYIHLRDNGVPVEPFVTYTVDKKKTDKVCLWVRKSDGLKSIADLKGKNLLDNASLRAVPSVDEILFENNINTPKAKYFKIIGEKQNPKDSAYAVVLRKADVMALSGVESKFLLPADARFKELTPLVCTKPFTNPLLVSYSKNDPELMQKLKKAWLSMHKDKEFKEIQFLFYAINGHFVEASDSDYNGWREFYKMALKKAWVTKGDIYER